MGLRPLLACLVAGSILFACGPAAGDPPLSEAERRARIAELWEEIRGEVPSVPTLTATEALERLEDPDLVLVDVRTREERSVSTLPDAITADELAADPDRYRDRRIVTYCTIGHRSALYTAELLEDGWDAWNLEGSILAWTHVAGPLVDPAGRDTKRVHVYDRKWNLVADGYEAVW